MVFLSFMIFSPQRTWYNSVRGQNLLIQTGANAPVSNLSCCLQHILDEDTVAPCGVVDEDMGDGADEAAVLDDGAAAHA